MKKYLINIKSYLLLFVATIILTSCGPSACDCANILSDRTADGDKLMKEAYDGNGDFKPRNDYWASRARDCMKQYTTMKDWEIEGIQSMGNLISHEAIENAKKECATKKEFSNTDLEIACDCWNQSVEKSGMAYDDMNSSQQQFRNKCLKIFGDEASMKVACDNASNK